MTCLILFVPFCSKWSTVAGLHDLFRIANFLVSYFYVTKSKHTYILSWKISISFFNRNFSSQVRSMNQFNLFDQPGRHTFFIPIDSAFEDLEKKLVDKDIIAGHIVPNKLLFTDPIINQPQRTSTYDRKNIKVTAEIEPNCEFVLYQGGRKQGGSDGPGSQYFWILQSKKWRLFKNYEYENIFIEHRLPHQKLASAPTGHGWLCKRTSYYIERVEK